MWFGDILSLYAIAAVPLWWILRCTPRQTIGASLGLLILPSLLSTLLFVLGDAAGAPDLVYGPPEAIPAFESGSAVAVFDANAAFLTRRWVLALASGRLPRLLGLFVLGALIVRCRPQISRRAWVVLMVTAAASNALLGALGPALSLPASSLGTARSWIESVAVPTGALAYAGVGWRSFSRSGPLTSTFAAAGRLSLTHYLGQSLIMAGLFYGVGLGLWGRLGSAESVAVGLAIVGLQVSLSPVIRARLGSGPGERALRWLSRS